MTLLKVFAPPNALPPFAPTTINWSGLCPKINPVGARTKEACSLVIVSVNKEEVVAFRNVELAIVHVIKEEVASAFTVIESKVVVALGTSMVHGVVVAESKNSVT